TLAGAAAERRRGDTVLLEPLIERAPGHAEPLGGAVDLTALGREDPLDVPPLDVHEPGAAGRDLPGDLDVRLRTLVEAERRRRQPAVAREQDRAFEHVAQLADVARPGVARQPLEDAR